MSTLEHLPARAMVLREYTELEEYTGRFLAGEFNLLVVVGEAFGSKPRVVRQSVSGRSLWLDAAEDPGEMYRALYEQRGRPVVFDNVDVDRTQRKCLPLVESFCGREVVKTLQRPEDGASSELPREFATNSPAMVLADTWPTLLQHVPAVEGCGELVFLEPSAEEYFDQVYRYGQELLRTSF